MTVWDLWHSEADFKQRVEYVLSTVQSMLGFLCSAIHELNRTWWNDPATGQPIDRNVGEMLMLVVTELAEAMQAYRTGARDSHISSRSGLEVELADALIRICDLAGGLNLDLAGAVREKLAYNLDREDHDPRRRMEPGGKKI